MNIMLSEILLSSEDEKIHRGLSTLLQILEGSPHALWHSLDSDKIPKMPWYQQESSRAQKRISNIFSNIRDPDKDRITLLIDISPAHPEQAAQVTPELLMTLDEALKFLQAPVHIVVENAVGDAPFIAYILKRFASTLFCGDQDLEYRKKLLACLVSPSMQAWPVQFFSGGGSTTARNVEELLRATIPARVLVVVDQDYRWPDARRTGVDPDDASVAQGKKVKRPSVRLPSGETGKKVFKIKQNARLKRHVLIRREQENYIPLSLIKGLRTTPADEHRLAAYAALPLNAQFCWDVKEGLRSSLREDHRSNPSSAYNKECWKRPEEFEWWTAHLTASNPPGEDISLLFYGFGNTIGDVWKDEKTRLDACSFGQDVEEEAQEIARKLIKLI